MSTSTGVTADETVRRLRLRLRRGESEGDDGETAKTTSSSPLAGTASILEASESSSKDGTYSSSDISASWPAGAPPGLGGSATGTEASAEAEGRGGGSGTASAAAEAGAGPDGLAAEPEDAGAAPAAGTQALVHSRA